MSYEDIISGQEPLPGAGASGGSVVSGSWLSDLTGAVTSIAGAVLPAVGSYFQNQSSIKGAMARAAASSGPPPGLTYPGLGYSAAQLTPGGAVPANYVYMGPRGIQLGPGDMAGGETMLPAMPGVGATGSWGGGGMGGNFHSAVSVARANRLVFDTNPVNGKVHIWYHVGSLEKVVREGLRACGYGRRSYRSYRRGGRRRPC